MKKLYVGNLPYGFDDQKLADLFSPYGDVSSATIIMDRATGRSKGFGFVEMDNADADKAMSTLNETEIEGRAIKISEARPMTERRDNRNRY